MIKCSKCNCVPIRYIEIWENYIIFDVIDGQIQEEGYIDAGYPTGITAVCKCGHLWKVRNKTQIIQLKDSPNE